MNIKDFFLRKPKNLSDVLAKTVERHPHKDLLICDQKHLKAKELDFLSTYLSNGLLTLNVAKGDMVGILLPNCIDFIVSFLAVAKIGAIAVPIDIYYGQTELENLLQQEKIYTLVTSCKFLETVKPATKKCLEFKNLILTASYQDYPTLASLSRHTTQKLPSIKAVDNLLYLYTSGTTGKPKGIMLNHKKVIAIARDWRKRFAIADSDKCYTLAPLFRSPALLSVIGAGIYYGITMVISSKFCPHLVWQQLSFYNISFFHGCPFHFAALAHIESSKNLKFPHLKLCYSTGNRLSPKVAAIFLNKFGIKINERYGTSEVGGISNNGHILSGVRVKLVDKQGKNILEKNIIGEIVVKTPRMAKNYYNLSQQHQAFCKGWFYTGDLGKIDRKNKLHVVCRKKTVFIIDNKEVYRDEIEQVLLSHTHVKEVMVKKDKDILKAIVVLKESCLEKTLLQFCKIKLDKYKIPMIEIRDELPRSWKAVLEGVQQDYPKWSEI